MVGSLKMNTALEYSTRVVQEGDRRCKKSTLNDLAIDGCRVSAGGHKEMSSILLTNRALVYEPKCGGRGELRGLSLSQLFNLCASGIGC
jgi:hypothetical protein